MNQAKVQQLNELYSQCVNCQATVMECPGIWKEHNRGVIPRGFYFETSPVKILAVGKNPGHPDDIEVNTYPGLHGSNLYQVFLDNSARFHSDLEKSLDHRGDRFQKNLHRYLSDFLDVETNKIYQHAAFTNLVKCSTPKEQVVLESKTMEECYRRYLSKEIDLLRPRVLLALGNEVEYFLLKKSWEFGIPVVKVRHPSVHYKKVEEEEILEGIKSEINQHLK